MQPLAACATLRTLELHNVASSAAELRAIFLPAMQGGHAEVRRSQRVTSPSRRLNVLIDGRAIGIGEEIAAATEPGTGEMEPVWTPEMEMELYEQGLELDELGMDVQEHMIMNELFDEVNYESDTTTLQGLSEVEQEEYR